MQWKHFFGRVIFSFFGTCLLGAVGAVALGMFAGVIALITTQSLEAMLIGFLTGGIGGFLLGGYHGYKFGAYLYKRFVEKDMDWPEPSFLSGRPDTISVKNAFVRDLKQLPEPMPTRLLTPTEIETYRTILRDKNDRIARDKLNHYEDFIHDASNLSLSRGNHLMLRFPVTIEHQKEHYYLAKTYERDFLLDNIEKNREDVREPIKGYPLLSPNIKVYSGYPKWIPQFVKNVLETLRRHQQKEKENEILLDNLKHTKLFPPKSVMTPTLLSIPEEKAEESLKGSFSSLC